MNESLGHVIESFDPANPGQPVATVAVPSPTVADRAIAAAVDAQPAWAASAQTRSTSLHQLAAGVERRSDALTKLMIREVGKPAAEARAEVDRAIAILRYYAQVALDPIGEDFPPAPGTLRLAVRRDPLGVVLTVCPWNFPLAIPLWKAAPALAFGNAVLMKPASQSVGVAELLAEAVRESLPPDVLIVLPLPAQRTAEILDDPRIAGVTFTGSTEVGLEIVGRLARRSAPAQAEMGGHSAAIVLADADVQHAAKLVVGGAMSYAGQKCTATRRVITVPGARRGLEEALAAEMETLVVGDPGREDVTAGPVIDARSANQFNEAVRGAQRDGGSIIAQASGLPEAGHFVTPTIVSLDDPDARANQEEVFGPLLTMITVSDDEEALRVANGTRYGLSGAVHSTDLERATALAARLYCGMQRVNAATSGVDYYAPFGGEAFSSFGPREQGRAAREFFTSTRTLSVAAPPG